MTRTGFRAPDTVPGIVHPRPLRPGDAVAVLSPSWGGPAMFPATFELGLQRLREVFGLEVVEYPTTRASAATPAERAADLHAAFADPNVAGIVASIGGADQLKVLAHLDPELLQANPKPFFGYSDNTNLHLFLWNLDIVSYHGASVMVELGRPGALHPATEQSLRQALFSRGEVQLLHPGASTDDPQCDWADPNTLEHEPTLAPTEPWSWHGGAAPAQGRLWGGNLEILDFHLRTGRYLPPAGALDDAVLFFETSEEQPSAEYVYRVLMCMGEGGLLQRFQAVIAGRPKAWSREVPNDEPAKRQYCDDQHQAVLRAMREYSPDVPVVLDVDFGHTDPQLVMPHGGRVRLNPAAQTLHVTY